MNADALQHLPAGFEAWPATWQAAVLFLSTFVLEDVAAIGGGLFLAAGALSWSTAFWPCFAGIWLGDVGLYALARGLGRRWFERSRLAKHRAKVARSEQWFAERGSSILIFSRLVPGARLPTYLAAGFLRLPLGRFLLVTGIASFAWTLVVLAVVQFGGTTVLGHLAFRDRGWTIILTLALVALLVLSARKLISIFARLRRWEFWPAWLFYLPVALHYFWLAILYRSFTAPMAANPGMFSGGIVGESKAEILAELVRASPESTAEAELLQGGSAQERLTAFQRAMTRHGWSYPVILKPDVGQRGMGVKVIRAEAQALRYFEQTTAPLIAQRYAPGPCEAGIFYYRFPGEARGQIFAITEKIFATVTGDGVSTISELIRNDARARYMAGKYLARFEAHEVLPQGKILKLVEAGNHAQGCIFKDGMHLLTPELAARIDEISRKLPGFYIGRYDIRYGCDDDLRVGKNFEIVELNGASAEATSIYDSRNTLRSAYRTLFRQWDLVFAIGAANIRAGERPTPINELWNKWQQCTRQAATLPMAD